MQPKLLAILFAFVLIAGSIAAQDVSNKAYPWEPASDTSANVPKGEVLQFSFNHSKIYPGTTRSYWVYIPKQYNPGKPACLYVCMDGVLYNAPTVFDHLINNGEMPVTIGVFIQSGVIMKDDSTVLRFNRTNEFDNMNSRFASFIETEILPDVEKHTASDGRAIHISPNANDHAIAGASSGAICAFTAAWQRPGMFMRVFSAIGTYIGMRGGDQYPVLVRKSEPKPIRVYLQDNNNDSWNPLFGNWFKANIDMEAALNFAGYEVTNTWQEGGHDTRQATEIFADAMRWLWKGWPAPVKAGWSANDMLQSILIKGETWQAEPGYIIDMLHTGVALPDSSRYNLRNGAIYYKPKNGKEMVADKDDNLGNAIAVSPGKDMLVCSIKHSHWLYCYQITADGSLINKQTLYWLHNPGNDDTSDINSMEFDTNGNLYVATGYGVQVCDQNGRVRAILSLPGGAVTALSFGGDKLDRLFVVCGGKVYSRSLHATGAPSWQKEPTPKTQGAG